MSINDLGSKSSASVVTGNDAFSKIATLNNVIFSKSVERWISPSEVYHNISMTGFGSLLILFVANYESCIILSINTNVVKTTLSTDGYAVNYLYGGSDNHKLVVDGAVKENDGKNVRVKIRTYANDNSLVNAWFIGYGRFA